MNDFTRLTSKPLAKVSMMMPWQGHYEAVITRDYVDFYKDGERVKSKARRYPDDQLGKELHHAWLTLISKFKLDDSDMRTAPVGVDLGGAASH